MDTLWLNEENDSLVIIDQTKLPNTLETLEITTPNALYDAIKTPWSVLPTNKPF